MMTLLLLQKKELNEFNHVHIKLFPQHFCGDTCQMWKWYLKGGMFGKFEKLTRGSKWHKYLIPSNLLMEYKIYDSYKRMYM